MAIGTIAAIGSAIGGVAGALKGPEQTTRTKNLGQASAYETQAQQAASGALSQFGDAVSAGPGTADVSAGAQSQRDLASMLSDYQKSGGLPGAEDIASGQGLAGRLFQQRNFDVRQNFREQQQQTSQQAALMGRNPLDPVLRNKMAQEQTRQLGSLQAEQGSFATQLAMDQPGKRLGFAQQRSGVLQGLASQALANRQALFGMGQQGLSQQQSFRLGAAGETSTGEDNRGYNALTGGLAGAGTGMGLAGQLQQQSFQGRSNQNTLQNQQLQNQNRQLQNEQLRKQMSAPGPMSSGADFGGGRSRGAGAGASYD